MRKKKIILGAKGQIIVVIGMLAYYESMFPKVNERFQLVVLNENRFLVHTPNPFFSFKWLVQEFCFQDKRGRVLNISFPIVKNT